MSVPIFPPILDSKAKIDGLNPTIPKLTLDNKMDEGTKSRFLGHNKADILEVTYELTYAEFEVLENFIKNVVSGGAIAFDYFHPYKQKYVRASFASSEEAVTKATRNGRLTLSVPLTFNIWSMIEV